MSTAARRVGHWNCPTGTSRAHGDRRTAVSEDDAELVMLQALFILDTFLNTSRDRENAGVPEREGGGVGG